MTKNNCLEALTRWPLIDWLYQKESGRTADTQVTSIAYFTKFGHFLLQLGYFNFYL